MVREESSWEYIPLQVNRKLLKLHLRYTWRQVPLSKFFYPICHFIYFIVCVAGGFVRVERAIEQQAFKRSPRAEVTPKARGQTARGLMGDFLPGHSRLLCSFSRITLFSFLFPNQTNRQLRRLRRRVTLTNGHWNVCVTCNLYHHHLLCGQ